MKVIFRRNYFGPNGSRHRPGVEYDVPDSWKAQLPKSATIVDEEKKPAKKAASVEDDDAPVKATASAAAGASSKGTKL